jgi:hypothetical protein
VGREESEQRRRAELMGVRETREGRGRAYTTTADTRRSSPSPTQQQQQQQRRRRRRGGSGAKEEPTPRIDVSSGSSDSDAESHDEKPYTIKLNRHLEPSARYMQVAARLRSRCDANPRLP